MSAVTMVDPAPDRSGLPPSLTAFDPSGFRGNDVSLRVISGIADSLDEICAGLSPFAELSPRIRGLGQRLRDAGGPQCPPAFAAGYSWLVAAVLDDDIDAALERLQALEADLSGRPVPFLEDWGALPEASRTLYERALMRDPSTVMTLEVPRDEAVQAARCSADEALAMLDLAFPDLAAELRALLSQIVFVAGTVNGDGRFDGATSFHAWGALFLNAEEHSSRLEMIDGLAHESGHALLYGLSMGRPFVTNPRTERHTSPLRRDPRPLDGIFHATYVSARMHLAHARVLAAFEEGRLALSPEETEQARSAMGQSTVAFRGGLEVLDRHADLTPLGHEVLSGARTYMQGAAGI
jgi:HEXXH motif-containing protein